MKNLRLDDIFESNEDFFRAILRVYTAAILKNINMITILEQFLDYLKSTE